MPTDKQSYEIKTLLYNIISSFVSTQLLDVADKNDDNYNSTHFLLSQFCALDRRSLLFLLCILNTLFAMNVLYNIWCGRITSGDPRIIAMGVLNKYTAMMEVLSSSTLSTPIGTPIITHTRSIMKELLYNV